MMTAAASGPTMLYAHHVIALRQEAVHRSFWADWTCPAVGTFRLSLMSRACLLPGNALDAAHMEMKVSSC
jgi:hypothetical protein